MNTCPPLATGRYRAVQRKDGRGLVVYGPDLPQAGMQWEGTTDYATEKEAVGAITNGDKHGMFDRFMLDPEPPAVEWGEENMSEEKMGEGMLTQKTPNGNAPTIIILMLGGSEGMLSHLGKLVRSA